MKTKTNHKLSSNFTFFIITTGALLLFLGCYVAIVLLYKPIISRSNAAYLNPEIQNILNLYQKDSRGNQVMLDCQDSSCQLISNGPILAKIKPEALLENLPTPTTSNYEKKVINSIGIIGDSISTGQYPRTLKEVYKIPAVDTFATIGSTTGNSAGEGGKYIGMKYQLEQQLLTSGNKYDYVIVFGGMNDLHNGIRIENIKSNLSNIYQIIKNNNIKVIAITVLPWKNYAMNDYSRSNRRWDEPTKDLNRWIKEQNPDVLVDAYSIFDDGYGGLIARYSSDGLHLNAEGHAMLAEKIYKALTTYK